MICDENVKGTCCVAIFFLYFSSNKTQAMYMYWLKTQHHRVLYTKKKAILKRVRPHRGEHHQSSVVNGWWNWEWCESSGLREGIWIGFVACTNVDDAWRTFDWLNVRVTMTGVVDVGISIEMIIVGICIYLKMTLLYLRWLFVIVSL